MRRCQRGDAGIGMALIMVIMLVGLFWWGGMHGGDGHRTGSRQQAMEVEKTPLELIDQAYARGDIKREEYLQHRADLTKR